MLKIAFLVRILSKFFVKSVCSHAVYLKYLKVLLLFFTMFGSFAKLLIYMQEQKSKLEKRKE